MVYDILFFLAIVGLSSLPFLRGLWKSELEKCRYQLFSVRDDLVYYVANNSIDKESKIFNYYYKNVNIILRDKKLMDLQGIIQFLKSGECTNAEFVEHQELLKEFKQTLDSSPDEIKETIKTYYEALRDILLINSNFFSVVYLVYRHKKTISERLKALEWTEPKVANAYASIKEECDSIGLAACH